MTFGDNHLDQALMDVHLAVGIVNATKRRHDLACGNCWIDANLVKGKAEVVLHKTCPFHAIVVEAVDRDRAMSMFKFGPPKK